MFAPFLTPFFAPLQGLKPWLKSYGLAAWLSLASWFTLAACLSLAHNPAWAKSDVRLPDLGDPSGGMLTPAQEYELGQKILRMFRSNMPLSEDPFYEVYLEALINKIVLASPLEDKRLELLVIKNPTLNAFAAPGGIVGVNTGIFLVANTEAQLASILSHELAHLSQRHFVRSQANQANNSMLAAAGLIGSIILGATAGADAGIAAATAVQAGTLQSQLRFSREMEQEADRIGMETLVAAKYDAQAMPDMFEVMQNNSRYRTKVPEFLLTHPLTLNRISDAKARADQYPRKPPSASTDTDFQFLRARALLENEESPQFAVKRFVNEIKGTSLTPLTAHYGLLLAYIKTGEIEKARTELAYFEKDYSQHTAIIVAKADIEAKNQALDNAIQQLRTALNTQPKNHILTLRLAELFMEAGRYTECEQLLTEHTKIKPKNPYTWYLLAEVHGLAGHILEVHKARAEYFILHGIYDKAEIQLRNAIQLMGDNFQARARLEQRLIDVKNLQKEKLGRNN